MMTTNPCRQHFNEVLSEISHRNLTHMSDLMRPENEALYLELWTSLRDFINFYALASRNQYSRSGRRSDGNAARVRALLERGMELEDIRCGIMLHVIDKFDHVLKKPLAAQPAYVYTMVNHRLVDIYRRLGPQSVSLDQRVSEEEDACTLGDLIADTLHPGPEETCLARETLWEALLAQKQQILTEISMLSTKPAELLVRVACTHLSMKPGKVASLIVNEGVENTYLRLFRDLVERYDISPKEIQACLTLQETPTAMLKADTKDPAKIAAQISRLVYRADKRLHR